MSAVATNPSLIPLGIIAALLVLVLFTKALRVRGVGLPYTRKSSLFSAPERHFLVALDRALGPKHRVFGKVRVADLVELLPGLAPAARKGALNRIAYKHFDYVVCSAYDLAVICAVELNDSSHADRRVKGRDELIANVCRDIGLPLLCVTARRDYDAQELVTSVERVARSYGAAVLYLGT